MLSEVSEVLSHRSNVTSSQPGPALPRRQSCWRLAILVRWIWPLASSQRPASTRSMRQSNRDLSISHGSRSSQPLWHVWVLSPRWSKEDDAPQAEVPCILRTEEEHHLPPPPVLHPDASWRWDLWSVVAGYRSPTKSKTLLVCSSRRKPHPRLHRGQGKKQQPSRSWDTTLDLKTAIKACRATEASGTDLFQLQRPPTAPPAAEVHSLTQQQPQQDPLLPVRSYVADLQSAMLALRTFKIAHQSLPCLIRSTSMFRQPPALTAFFCSIHHPESALRVANNVAAEGRRITSLLSVAIGPRRRHKPVFTTAKPLHELTISRQSSIRPSLHQLTAPATVSLHRHAQRRRNSTQRSMDCNTGDRRDPSPVHLSTGAHSATCSMLPPSLSPHRSPSPTNLHPSRRLWWTAQPTHRPCHPSVPLPQPTSLHPFPHSSPRRTFCSWSQHHRKPRLIRRVEKIQPPVPTPATSSLAQSSATTARFPTRLAQSSATKARFPTHPGQSITTARFPTVPPSQALQHVTALSTRIMLFPVDARLIPDDILSPLLHLNQPLLYSPTDPIANIAKREEDEEDRPPQSPVFAALPDCCLTLICLKIGLGRVKTFSCNHKSVRLILWLLHTNKPSHTHTLPSPSL